MPLPVKPSPSLRLALVAAALSAVAAIPLRAQLLVTAADTPAVITFDSAVANVNSYNATQSRPGVVEPGSWDYTASQRTAMNSLAWNIPAATSITHPFTTDVNNDGDSTDQFDVSSINIRKDYAPLVSGGGINWGLILGGGTGAWADAKIVLRVQNGTGATVNNWNFTMDSWFISTAANTANLTVRYSTDGTNFSGLNTKSTTNTITSGNASTANPEDWAAHGVNNSFSATVLAGESLYLEFELKRPSGGVGATWLLDNLAVTASTIPEPSTFALLLGFGTLGMVALRRHR